MELKGKGEVKKNIDKAIQSFIRKARASLLEIGREIRARGTRITPVDTGNLINSWYGPVIQGTDRKIRAEIGLTAEYAFDVHERIGGKWQKPGAQAKFLENPLKEIESEIGGKLQRDIKV